MFKNIEKNDYHLEIQLISLSNRDNLKLLKEQKICYPRKKKTKTCINNFQNIVNFKKEIFKTQ